MEYELFPENNCGERILGLQLPHGAFWIVRVDGVLAGYSLCCLMDNHLVDILRLGVRAQYRRLGIGARLLQASMSLAGHIVLTVRMQNDPAIRLYQRHGFEITGSMPQHYSWTMEFKKTSS